MWWMAVSVAVAATVEIAPGEDWCSAANSAAAGDEIVLGDGEHAGPCTLRADGITVRGDGSTPTIVYPGASSNVIDVEASDLTLSDLRFGPTQPNIDAVKIKSGDGVRIAGCVFERVGGISIAANSSDSVGMEIVDNHFDDLQATGIYLGCHDGSCRAVDFLIADNLIDGVVSSGVGYGMETKLNSAGVIRDNVIHDTQGPGIEVYGAEALDAVTVVERNYVVGSTNNGALEIGGGPAVVRNNIVVGGNAAGIYAYDYGGRGLQREVQILGNTVIGTVGEAIRVSSWGAGNGLVIANNAAWQASGYGPALPSDLPGVDMTANTTCDGSCWVDASAGDYTPVGLGPGASGYDMAVDFCGALRADPPLQGAVELDGPGVLSIDFKAGFDCADPGGTTPTGPTGDGDDDDAGEPSGDDLDAADSGGCGCVTGTGPVGWFALVLGMGGVVGRRRAGASGITRRAS